MYHTIDCNVKAFRHKPVMSTHQLNASKRILKIDDDLMREGTSGSDSDEENRKPSGRFKLQSATSQQTF